MANRGRKSQAAEWLTEDGLLLLEGYARDKMTDKDIAEKIIGIAERTFSDWKVRYSAISAALKKGRAPIVEKIENSLYALCEVQEYTDTIIEETQDPDGKVVSRHIRKTKRQVPPNTTAIIFALKNLKGVKWRDKQEVSVRDQTEIESDNFLEALNGTASTDWESGDDAEDKEADTESV